MNPITNLVPRELTTIRCVVPRNLGFSRKSQFSDQPNVQALVDAAQRLFDPCCSDQEQALYELRDALHQLTGE